MEFSKIPVVLKRYEFGAKMNICQQFSTAITDVNGLCDIAKLRQGYLPWELEIFALFSVITDNEYSNQSFNNEKAMRQFHEIMNQIRNYMHPKLHDLKATEKFADFFMIVTGLTQFQLQENIYFKFYRYNYIFAFKNENVDMEAEFDNKFGISYSEIMNFAMTLNFVFASQFATKVLIAYVLNKYSRVVNIFSISRKEFKNKQTKVVDDVHEFIYGFRFFYQFPFIYHENQFFIPLPHLIIQAATTSMIFRLTEGNDTLRQKFGKDVLESYLHHLCNKIDNIDEIYPEFGYKKAGSDRRTLDLMLRNDDYFVLLDSKAFSPRIDLRNLNESAIEYATDIIVKSVVQVYNHLTERFAIEYNPFIYNRNPEKVNTFGIVVLSEDGFIRRENIMKVAASKLGISLESDAYQYLCSNIKILSLYSIEEIVFNNYSLIDLLISNRDNENKWFDYTILNSSIDTNRIDSDVEICAEKLQRVCVEIIDELVNAGLINKT